MCTPSKYRKISEENKVCIAKYSYAPISLCKTSIVEKIIIPSGSCALVFTYIWLNVNTKIPSTAIFAMETMTKITESTGSTGNSFLCN